MRIRTQSDLLALSQSAQNQITSKLQMKTQKALWPNLPRTPTRILVNQVLLPTQNLVPNIANGHRLTRL
jgi:hypothetical protein